MRSFDYGLRHFHFPQIEIQKRPIHVDRRNSDHRVVHAELADEVDGRLADDTAIGMPHEAAGDHHLGISAPRAGCWLH
jgi:hypothetical protein